MNPDEQEAQMMRDLLLLYIPSLPRLERRAARRCVSSWLDLVGYELVDPDTTELTWRGAVLAQTLWSVRGLG